MWICGQPARSRRLPTSPHRDNDDDDYNNSRIDLPIDACYTVLNSKVGWRASKEPRELVQWMGSTSTFDHLHNVARMALARQWEDT
jgi:hypothetical protein